MPGLVQEDRPDQRQAVLRAVGLGLHLDPLPDREDPERSTAGTSCSTRSTKATSRCGTTARAPSRSPPTSTARTRRRSPPTSSPRSRPSGRRRRRSTRRTGPAETDLVPDDADGRASGRLRLAGRATRRCSAHGVPVAYANPKEGRNSWVGVYGIRKDIAELRPRAASSWTRSSALLTGQNLVNELLLRRSANGDVMKRASPTPTAEAGILGRRPVDPGARRTSRRTSPRSSAMPGRRCGPR